MYKRQVVDGFVLEDTFDELAKRGDVQNIPYIIGANGNDFGLGVDEPMRKSKYYHSMIDFANLRNEHHGEPTYLYLFNRKLPSDDAGAFHLSLIHISSPHHNLFQSLYS